MAAVTEPCKEGCLDCRLGALVEKGAPPDAMDCEATAVVAKAINSYAIMVALGVQDKDDKTLLAIASGIVRVVRGDG